MQARTSGMSGPPVDSICSLSLSTRLRVQSHSSCGCGGVGINMEGRACMQVRIRMGGMNAHGGVCASAGLVNMSLCASTCKQADVAHLDEVHFVGGGLPPLSDLRWMSFKTGLGLRKGMVQSSQKGPLSTRLLAPQAPVLGEMQPLWSRLGDPAPLTSSCCPSSCLVYIGLTSYLYVITWVVKKVACFRGGQRMLHRTACC